MKNPPAFFEPIRIRAANRWEQLEQDPELAGPWHQLFKQVQSPRHILSELLQNADDAGATEAFVRIEGKRFVFEHNGMDFESDHFASICRFGYSNKRALHTIGFRGIGFKSTFSLGDQVELFTPSLSVGFHRNRFSEPLWLHSEVDTGGLTRVQVEISDHHRQREVEKNLEEWLKSPVSLLFFKNIRRMQIGDREVHWRSLGKGLVPHSEQMTLGQNDSQLFLLIRSEAETFPSDALAEIRQERMLGNDDAMDFPPCRVEIVLGAKGRLYVVLPTGVETDLPFACNAPFIQDPARLKIKDPETSPTNRWLLERAGQLAASSLCHWLQQSDQTPIARSGAYNLVPLFGQGPDSLDGLCNSIAKDAFFNSVAGEKLILTESGDLVAQRQSIFIPQVILDIWKPEQILPLLDPTRRPILCKEIRPTNRQKLLELGWIDQIDIDKFLSRLRANSFPKPDSWRKLLNLWAYVAPEVTGFRNRGDDVQIFPVQGHDVLFAAKDIVRLGDKRLLQSESDWEFLSEYLVVLNPNWTNYLADQSRELSDRLDSSAKARLSAYAVMSDNGLQESSDISKVIDQVAGAFFVHAGIKLEGCIRLAQIAAKLGANIGSEFRFATKDRKLKTVQQTILVDENGALIDLLVPADRDGLLLHPNYSSSYRSCTKEDWKRWIDTNRTGLQTLMPLVQSRKQIIGKPNIEAEAHARGVRDNINYHYVTHQFAVEDWDFEKAYWQHWETLAADDGLIWSKLTERILEQKESYWYKAKSARLLHVSSNGSTKAMTLNTVTPSWILHLRRLPCLLDTRGFPRRPDELMRRTPETESLMDVELFVHGRIDREANRPLLDLLGVRSTPTGPDRLLDCLRALATSKNPPGHEVEKWYRRLDHMVDSCTTEDFQKIRQAFQSEHLILTQDGVWEDFHLVFIQSDEEDVPDAAVIRIAVKDLSLWRKIGIADRPTVDLAITWLKSLPVGSALPPDDMRRVKGLLARHPKRIWDECKHWVNLAGEWAPIEELCYSLTMSSLTAWSHLHQWVKKKTADFQKVPGDFTSLPPFCEVPTLSSQLDQRLKKPLVPVWQAEEKNWLTTFGIELSRVDLITEDETTRVRNLALLVSKVKWLESAGLEIIPFIDGTPAGTAKQVDVVWDDSILYVDRIPKAKLARRVPEEIGRIFNRQDIKAALDYSFDRPSEDVREYLEENFTLVSVALPVAEPVLPVDSTDSNLIDDQPQPANVKPTTLANADEPEDSFLVTPVDASHNVEPDFTTEDAGDLTSELPEKPQTRPTPKPVKPSIMERYALAKGFLKLGNDRFIHPSGNWIARTNESLFPWEYRNAKGDLLHYCLAKDHCLEVTPLPLDAEVWSLIDKKPEAYVLILLNTDDEPIEITGAKLRGMCDDGRVALYPATYRLVYQHDHQQE